MFTPLDILYIVLAFSVLWISAALFWLIWQVASILKSVNDTLTLAQETFEKIEDAVAHIRQKFDNATSTIPLLIGGIKKLVDYAVDKKKDMSGKEEK